METNYTYRIGGVFESGHWIAIVCNEEDARESLDPFVDLLKTITKKCNDGQWEGKVYQTSDMRYKIQNDPLDLTYQWDSMFGIVFDYTGNPDSEVIKTCLLENYGIK